MTQKKPTPTIKKAVKQIKARGLLNSRGEKDDELIQINTTELGLLRRVLGTQGEINPKTGLLSFKGGGGDGDGGGADRGGGSSGGGTGGGNGGNNGGGRGRDGPGGDNAGGARDGGASKSGPGPGAGGNRSGGPNGPDTTGAGPRGVSRAPGATGSISGAEIGRANVGPNLEGAGPRGVTPGVIGPGATLDADSLRSMPTGTLGINRNPSVIERNPTFDEGMANNPAEKFGLQPNAQTPSLVDRALNGLLGGIGVNISPDAVTEQNLTTGVTSLHNAVNIDPIGAALGIAGLVNPTVGLIGTVYSRAMRPAGIMGPQISFDTSSLGSVGVTGPRGPSGATGSSGSNGIGGKGEQGYGGLPTTPAVDQALAQSGLLSTVSAPPKPMTPVDPRQVFSYSTYGLPGYSLGAPGYKY